MTDGDRVGAIAKPWTASPVHVGPPILLAVYLRAVRAGFPSPADDYLDAPIDLTQTLIHNAPATFIMTVAGDSAIDVGIFDGSLITVDRSLVPRDGDAVVVDVNGERSIKIFRIAGGRSSLTFGNRRYPEYEPGSDAEIDIFGVVTNTVRRFRR
ncbi:hypothetical protein AXW83_25735 [Bosea sp. PAMC 26642]|nr:hypothetical protein AXW83_25735 [Bosea sp. PAMC 26642]